MGEVDLEKVMGYVFRVAQAPNLNYAEASRTIADQIKVAENSRHFPEFHDTIDPDSYSAETKLLDKEAKKRLRRGIEIYSQSLPQGT